MDFEVEAVETEQTSDSFLDGWNDEESLVADGEADQLEAEAQEEVLAPAAGLVFTQRSYSAVYPGTLIARLCRKE